MFEEFYEMYESEEQEDILILLCLQYFLMFV